MNKRGGEFIAALDELWMEKLMRDYEASGPVGTTPATPAEEVETDGDDAEAARSS